MWLPIERSPLCGFCPRNADDFLHKSSVSLLTSEKEQNHDSLNESQTHSEILPSGHSLVMPWPTLCRCRNESLRIHAGNEKQLEALLLCL